MITYSVEEFLKKFLDSGLDTDDIRSLVMSYLCKDTREQFKRRHKG